MSKTAKRKSRNLNYTFKVICEGDTEYNYVEAFRKKYHDSALKITIKTVNVKGGGIASILSEVKKDSLSNCIGKFIVMDADRAIGNSSEEKALKELIDEASGILGG